jgi:AcrR family transcriptional regulator
MMAKQEKAGPKERTQRLLTEAARDLLRTGQPLTVQAAANLAGVSRATAYRYFPSNESVVLHATNPFTEDAQGRTAPLPAAVTPDGDLPAQAAALVRDMGTWAFEHENELRALLALSLSPERADRTPRRGSTSRDRWIARLLEGLPDDVAESDRERLAAALTPLFGADAVVWTKDIAKLAPQQALDLLAWMAATLVRATLGGSSPT